MVKFQFCYLHLLNRAFSSDIRTHTCTRARARTHQTWDTSWIVRIQAGIGVVRYVFARPELHGQNWLHGNNYGEECPITCVKHPITSISLYDGAKTFTQIFFYGSFDTSAHTHGSLVHEFYEHAHFLVFITLSLSVFTSLLRAFALDTLRCCVYKISCVLARKRIVTRLQAIWSLIYVSFFFVIPLVVFVLPKENKSYPNRQKIQCVRSGTHKRKTISMHNGKRILFKTMTMSKSPKYITNVDCTSWFIQPIYDSDVYRLLLSHCLILAVGVKMPKLRWNTSK